MKYIRFTQVDAKTKISINVEHSKEGPIWPELKGLTILFQDNINSEFWYGTVDDDAEDNPENQCWIIDQTTLSVYVKQSIDRLIKNYKSKLYDEEKQVRHNILGKYDATASLAGIYKYEQALILLSDNNAAAPDIRAEATAREVDPVIMAERIKTNHESFRNAEAKIAGIRGKLLDRLNTYEFDSSDPIASWDNFNKMEFIGTEQRDISIIDSDDKQTEIIEITSNYYGTDIAIRFKFTE